MNMAKRAEYLEGIARWVLEQRKRLAQPSDDLASYRELAEDFLLKVGVSISRETFRAWEEKEIVKSASPEKEQAIALYCQQTGQEIPPWLHINTEALHAMTLMKLIEVAPLPQVANAIARGLERLQSAADTVKAQRLCLAAASKLRSLIGKRSIEKIAAGAQMSTERLEEILSGGLPELSELVFLSQCLDIEISELVALYAKPSTAESSEPAAVSIARRHR